MTERKVPIEVSARHVHLSAEHLVALFGREAKLTVFKKISQPGQFAANETVSLIGPKGELKLRIVGPVRAQTQVEITATEAIYLGLEPVLKVSGDLKNTPGACLRGPAGEITIANGVIVAQRHLHISPTQAKEFGLKPDQIISIKTTGSRPITFHNVIVRSHEGVDELSLMLDTDEANAGGLKGGEKGIILA